MVLRDLALLVAGSGGDPAPVVSAIPDEKARRQAERRLAERAPFLPRPFFW